MNTRDLVEKCRTFHSGQWIRRECSPSPWGSEWVAEKVGRRQFFEERRNEGRLSLGDVDRGGNTFHPDLGKSHDIIIIFKILVEPMCLMLYEG